MCQCGEMYHWTCSSQSSSEVFKPPLWPMNTTDVLFDLETQNINEWLLQTHSDFIDTRFGGWSVANNSASKNLKVWYNNKAYHTLPAYTNALHNATRNWIVALWHCKLVHKGNLECTNSRPRETFETSVKNRDTLYPFPYLKQIH